MEGQQPAALSGIDPVAPPAAPEPPPTPREYHQLMRRPRHAWWRPWLAIVLAATFALLFLLLVIGAVALAAPSGMLDQALLDGGMPLEGFALTNLFLAAMIPVAMLASRLAHGTSAGFVSSVVGRLRWSWMLRCAAIAVLPMLLVVVVSLLLDWPREPRPEQWLLFALLVLFGTPLQAAGEEYLVRGVVFQGVGAMFRHPETGLVAATLLSSLLFAVLHASADPWILIDMGIFALACCVLIWQTGGLEAAIALHAVNNMVSMLASLLVGGWNEGFVGPESQGSPVDALLTLFADGIIVWLILKQARRLGIRRTGWLPARVAPVPQA